MLNLFLNTNNFNFYLLISISLTQLTPLLRLEIEPGHHKLKYATCDCTHEAVWCPSQTSTVQELLTAHSDGVELNLIVKVS